MSVRWAVRRAEAADAPRLAEINLTGWRTAYRGILPDAYLDSLRQEDREDKFAARLAAMTERTVTYVAANPAGEIGAYATAVGDSRPGMLGALYAALEWRGTGAGHTVHEAALAHLTTCGFSHAVVWVFEENFLSRRFYENHGWLCDQVTQTSQIADRSAVEIRYSRLLP
ncbi:GNAT family N-acetyltransferase [Amycolatopsis magusensis]|uniref:GNAT superfamily N-acetyltransferase n=1 Tax=Amycolatopsis magusensis TaxID=882444 RepID=A0ABS4PS96_9PSEU|nr:GNAT family N-acetyltransferase [Amycolatopsis magusensis]MBP2182294.1 GNAT superfamily N-acetyltransferase [Amycolatopsis magusensis]